MTLPTLATITKQIAVAYAPTLPKAVHTCANVCASVNIA